MYRLYDALESGNAYKVRLVLHQLGIPFERIEVDFLRGATRTPEFLAMNLNGRVPVLELAPGKFLAESNAIIWFLAEGTPLVPNDRGLRAEVLQWMFFEQYNHEPNVATPRFWLHHPELMDSHLRVELGRKQERGRAALAVMERHLSTRRYFVGDRYSIADIALYAYSHVAPEGGIELDAYPVVRAWIGRVAAEPRHIPITQG
ncbi:MAG TPA: glutathione S-transferase family protein [Candidatus Cybelea sp.]|nr:glutathione S-transferase family protein [Candidatus Cybelea sp.]